jgi:large subunit ribosomal protein L25
MAEAITLVAERRDKGLHKELKAKALRREGYVPAVIYGPGFETQSLAFSARDVSRAIHEAGISSIVEIKVEGEAQPLSALFREMQRDPVDGQLLHVDLYHVTAGQMLRNAVPVVAEGFAPVTELGATIAQILQTVDVECLPMDMPHFLVADISILDSPHSLLVAGDLQIPENVVLLTDPDTEIFQVNMPRMVEEEEEEEELALYGEAAIEGEEEESPEKE